MGRASWRPSSPRKGLQQSGNKTSIAPGWRDRRKTGNIVMRMGKIIPGSMKKMKKKLHLKKFLKMSPNQKKLLHPPNQRIRKKQKTMMFPEGEKGQKLKKSQSLPSKDWESQIEMIFLSK